MTEQLQIIFETMVLFVCWLLAIGRIVEYVEYKQKEKAEYIEYKQREKYANFNDYLWAERSMVNEIKFKKQIKQLREREEMGLYE